MGRIQDAFLAGRNQQDQGQAARVVSGFEAGTEWARTVLLPAIENANADLAQAHVTFRVDTNLDPHSTNHAHVDFWLVPLGGEPAGGAPHGIRHSINVRDGRDVWLFRHGESGENLGTIDSVGPAQCETMLARAAGEYGKLALR
ncbi:MAG: hypothetical protein HXX10_21375 [Rhodoplanes sp.]|uniref:hypothetical protein n=1 Tax=Rhodoplanes sp. TaxID=1968906 RepID=UPI001804443F|nr:hypothetical protein [Rhodoplanes sp.]NVO16587.1 hypothetical protein [Rhodoplanes sp.]